LYLAGKSPYDFLLTYTVLVGHKTKPKKKKLMQIDHEILFLTNLHGGLMNVLGEDTIIN
jgi:hypothetical protein